MQGNFKPSRKPGAMMILVFFISIILNPGLRAQQEKEDKQDFIPDLDAILKTKVEYDLDHSLMRFEVRNARFGVRGKINDHMGYRFELDLSDEGELKMLDAWVSFYPTKNFIIYLGQKKIPFSTDYLRSPADNIFANRSFLAKYINDGLRDIGIFAEYKTEGDIPLNIQVGGVNGTGNNNPDWISKPGLAGRLTAGNENGFRMAGNIYLGEDELRDRQTIFGGEVRYATGDFFIESEYITRSWTDTLSARIHDDGLYIHSWYNFRIENRMVKIITPSARWDMMGNSVFSDESDASRITLGLNFGFEPRQFHSEIRINYENYFKQKLPIHTDKLTLEFIARF